MTEPKVDTAQRGYAAFNRGDYEQVIEVLDPSIVWDASGGFPDGVIYRGHEGFHAFLHDSFKIWESFQLEPEESGVEVRPRWGWVWRFRAGKVVELAHFVRWEDATARFEAATTGGP